MVEPKSNWVHVEGVECELFDQAHIPNGWMSGWGDGKTFHYHIPPPAPPRSEGETVVLHRDVEPDSIYPKWDTCIFPASDRESECHGFGGTPYEHAEFVPATALEQSARDAAKKERHAIFNDAANLVAFAVRMAREGATDEQIAERLRALPPEEGKP